jgi:uncharacterized phage-like protein YoqJ
MEQQNLCCALIGQPPMRFPWGFDEEDSGCQNLKLALAQKIMELRQQGVTRFAVVADCGVGLYAGECINALRAHDPDLMLFVVSPHEEQATKWAPYLRERYFKLLEDCTLIELASHRWTPECEYDAYRKIIDYSGMVLAAYDPAAAKDTAVDRAMEYVKERGLPVVTITCFDNPQNK